MVCPQCGADYIIQFPASGPFLRLLESLDKLVGRLCPVVAGGVCVGSLYWTCVTYGAVTVMQVLCLPPLEGSVATECCVGDGARGRPDDDGGG